TIRNLSEWPSFGGHSALETETRLRGHSVLDKTSPCFFIDLGVY
ncbi:MAG: hypothetical protein US25_C0038G0001, partial [Candidatus Moranbacteria bacterium GW2011_GWE1_36_7]